MFAGTQFGRYEITSKIGEGGMGEVYSAHDTELDRNVAIKLLPTEFVSDEDRRMRFRQEARVVSSLNHPNIITIYEIGENEHGSFLATEFIEGITLRELLMRERLTLTRALKIIEQAANGLIAAHEAKVIHRDVKPENIMVRSDLIVKVLDFGLAKSRDVLGGLDGSASSKTVPGTVMGSARYMSPEQARGLEVDERTDIWSLGVVLWEMLVGAAPFDGETTADTIAAVIYKDPVPPRHLADSLPQEVQRILKKALQKEREARYQSVSELAEDVKILLLEIEHANSGGRKGHTTSSSDFNENPTMLHSAVSGELQANKTNLLTTGEHSFTREGRSGMGRLAAFAGVAVMLAAIAAAAVYYWYPTNVMLANAAFERPQISRVNTDGRVMMPAISPDGKYLAYVAGDSGSRSLVVRQVATDSTVTIVPPGDLELRHVSFSPDGDHVYYCVASRDNSVNTLYQLPTLGGTPKKLNEDVDSPVTFSPDGKSFAFVRHVVKSSEDAIIIANSQTLAETQLLSSGGTGYGFFAPRVSWSPMGDTILVAAGVRKSGFVVKTDVAEVNIAHKTITALNEREFFTLSNPIWFADGSGFVFTAREDVNTPAQIYRSSYPAITITPVTNDFNDYQELGLDADGSSLVTLKGNPTGSVWRYSPATRSNVQLTGESRHLDGMYGVRQLNDESLIMTRLDGKEGSIWITDRDGKNGRPVLSEKQGFAVYPLTTPDGRYIVYNMQKDKASRIWRVNADGSDPLLLSGEAEGNLDLSPQLANDGRTVIFQRRAGDDERFKLMKVSIDGGPVELFYQDEYSGVFMPTVSPDGKRIAFTSFDLRSFEKKLLIASIIEGRFGNIEEEIEYDRVNHYAWAPDSRSLTIATSRGGTQNLWRQPIGGGEAVSITDFKSGRIFCFSWASNGRDLLISRGTINNDLIIVRDLERLNARLAARAGAKMRRPAALRG
ncbi:MAG: serine/threonine-protein kinase [Blastocatellia bacterium]|nr:serine/threonine-protein kinase [Blastocatellia bacterium]